MQCWRYSPSLGSTRLEALATAGSFSEILETIAKSAHVLCVHNQGCDDIAGFARTVATIRVQPEMFDLFFNSQDGYRGAYARSPYAGFSANDQALETLTPLVLTYNETNQSKIDSSFVVESLGSPSAKIWLAEIGLDICALCTGEWANPVDSTPEIFNGVWDQATGVEATWGRKAPYFTKIKLIGAFLNNRYDEYVPAHKRHRAQLIHQRGWA